MELMIYVRRLEEYISEPAQARDYWLFMCGCTGILQPTTSET